MNVVPSPKYHECEYTFFVPAIRDPYLVGLLNRLNDCVALKYQHIVKLCMLIAGLPSNSVNAALG